MQGHQLVYADTKHSDQRGHRNSGGTDATRSSGMGVPHSLPAKWRTRSSPGLSCLSLQPLFETSHAAALSPATVTRHTEELKRRKQKDSSRASLGTKERPEKAKRTVKGPKNLLKAI